MSGVPKDIGGLLDRARDGVLSVEEGKAVGSVLDTPQEPRTLYTLVHIVARGHPEGGEEVLARFMGYSDDPQVAALALSALGGQWRCFDLVHDQTVAALRGLPWDVMDEVRDAAVTVAGEYLRERRDPEMLDLLLVLVVDADRFEQGHRLHALGRALGASDVELAERARDFGEWSDDQIIDLVFQRLEGEGDEY